ncbi:MAG: Tyrosine-tRNA ligase [Parcubacteria group bacterium GW2011_GWA1_40_21]|nr:MAG: Tyrosine-tRNA ligase [Parcubacteria group bacterium GW2011_GWA1_40_21]
MNSDQKNSEIEELFERGAEEFIDPEGKFKEKLLKKAKEEYEKDIIVKFGVDPTRPDIHLGHAVVFRKLRKFQDLGCKVVFLVGDYTAQIGDPTGRSKIRPEIEQKEVEANMKTYLDQVGKILRTNKKSFSWIRNSDWFTAITDLELPKGDKVKMSFEKEGKKTEIDFDANSFVGKAAVFEKTRMQGAVAGFKGLISVITLKSLLWTLKHITHSRLVERDMFQERIKGGKELFMHEMLYPVLQGVDSFVISEIYGSCDLEIGGTDQTFNMLMGRDILKINKKEQQAVMSLELLEGTDGKEKMSKSLDNYIAITDEPNDMYGKIMSLPDTSIVNYFNLCTYTPQEEIKKIESEMKKGKMNPKDAKMRLAREIVVIYHGEDKAEQAEQNFIKTFQKGGLPEDLEEIIVPKGITLSKVLLDNKVVKSNTEWRTLVSEGAVSNAETSEKINSFDFSVDSDITIKVGKRRFLKISVNG